METIFNEIEINDLVTVRTDHCWFTGVVSRKYEVVNNEGKVLGLELFIDDKGSTIQFTSKSIIDLKVWNLNENKEKLGELADKYGFKYCDDNGNLFGSSVLLGSVISSGAYERFTDDEKKKFIKYADLETEDIKDIMDLYVFKQAQLVKAGEEKLKLLKEQKELMSKCNKGSSWSEQLLCGLLIAGAGLKTLTDIEK